MIVALTFWISIALGVLGYTVKLVGPIAFWATGALMMVTILIQAGREINGQWFGILIDSRNKFSLSRLQIVLWTIMVLSAYLTISFPRVVATQGVSPKLTQQQALDIQFPRELVLAMGISAVSFAGATLIKSNKKSKQTKIDARNTPDSARENVDQAKREFSEAEDTLLAAATEEENQKRALEAAQNAVSQAANDAAKQAAQEKLDRAQALLQAVIQKREEATRLRAAKQKAKKTAEEELASIVESQGLLHKNSDPSEASWADLFRGEEIGNYKLVDMSKVQMLFFTLVVVMTYAFAIANMLLDVDKMLPSVSLPEFSESLNALLGISHGTYLSVKTVDHS